MYVCASDWNAPAASTGNSQPVDIGYNVNCPKYIRAVYGQVFCFFIKDRNTRHEQKRVWACLCVCARDESVFKRKARSSCDDYKAVVNVNVHKCATPIVCITNSTETFKFVFNFVDIRTHTHTNAHTQSRILYTCSGRMVYGNHFYRVHNKTWIHFMYGTQQ